MLKRKFIGRSMAFISLIFLIISLLFGLSFALFAQSEGINYRNSNAGFQILLPISFFSLSLFLSIMFIEGRKRTILFLRPFGMYSNNQAVNLFITKMNDRYSIIALDDGHLLSRKTSFSNVLIALLVLFPMAGCMFFLSALYFPSMSMTYIDIMSMNDRISGFGNQKSNEILTKLPSMIMIAFSLILVRLAFRAFQIRSNVFQISSNKNIKKVTNKVSELSGSWWSHIFSVRSILVQTNSELWKTTVKSLSNYTDFVLIDASKNTKNILWELDYLRKGQSGGYIIIADQDSPNLPEELAMYQNVEYYSGEYGSDMQFVERVVSRVNKLRSAHELHWSWNQWASLGIGILGFCLLIAGAIS